MAAAQELIHIGRYEIKRVLGKGAMGIVYEGLDPKLHRQVAIKTILLDQLDKETAHDYAVRFVREAQAVARLNHPNIVRVFDFGEEDAVAYIVMEFIKGKELKDYFDNHHQFPIADIVRIMCELLGALEVAHEHHIIHRDIKPANVMMDSQGRAKLTDFGVARVADADRTHVERTAVGTVVGTPSYMSPEQISGESVDHRTDLFSAGIVLYQFLTGEKPFTGEGAWMIARKIMSEDPRRPSEINVAIPKEYDNVIWRALAKTPERRYANAREFSDALKRVLAGGPAEIVTKQAPAAPYDLDATLLAPMEDPLAAPMRPTPGDTRPGGLPQQARQAPEAKVTNAAELEFWLAIKDSDDAEDFDLYVQQFPTGLYADLARRKVRKLQQGAAAASEASSTQIRAREALQLQEDTARNEAEAIATREAEEQARQQEQARVRREADLVARQEAEAKAQREAEEIAKAEAAARAKREAEELARLEAEAKAQREAEEKARLEAQAKAKREGEERARRAAEEQAWVEAQAKARREAEERARLDAEAKAKREAEEKARLEAQVKAKREAEELARKAAEEQARLEAQAKAKRETEEKARLEAQAKAKREAEERARLEAEAKAKREAEEKTRLQALAKTKREAEEQARKAAEEQARLEALAKAKREAEELARLEAEAKAQREAEERALLEAQAKAKAKAKAKREAEELARKAAEAKAQRDAEQLVKVEAAVRAKRETEELARLEAEAKAKREAEEQARLEAQAKAKREAEERARLADEARTKRGADEKARVAVQAYGQVLAGVAHAESPDVQQQSAATPVKKSAMLVPVIVAVLALLGGGGYMMFGRSAAPSPEVARTPEATPKTTTAPAPVSPAQPAPKVEVATADPDAGPLAAKRKAEEKAKRDADEADHRDAADKAKKDSADKIKSEVKRLADEKAKKDADEKTKTEAEAKRLTDEQAKKDAVEKAKSEAEAKRLAGEKTKKDAEDRAKREADEKVKVAALTPVPEAADPPKSAADVNALMEQGLAAEKGGRMGEAVRFYKQASAAGSGIAAKRLGDIYGKGSDGVPRSYQESLRYLEIARTRGIDVPKTVSK